MQKFTTNSMRLLLALTIFVLLTSSETLFAQVGQRGYTSLYSANIQGDFAMIGNTLMADYTINGSGDTVYNAAENVNTTGNNTRTMKFIAVDPSTSSSSKATLSVPAGSTIVAAWLYWGAGIDNRIIHLTSTASQQIKIKFASDAAYTTVTGSIDSNHRGTVTQYQGHADITSWLSSRGGGEYTVANIAATPGALDPGGSYAGWSITVVYSNASLPYKSVRVYDGYKWIYGGGSPTTASVTLSGLDVPPGTPSATTGSVVWEGDGDLTGDYLQVNGTTFSNALNPANNTWNGTISTNGSYVHSKVPDLNNQMSLDIDQFDVSSYLLPSSTTTNLLFASVGDSYYPGVIAYSVDSKNPTVTLNKTYSLSSGQSEATTSDVITFTISGTNVSGFASNNVITDTLPNAFTYVSNSLQILTSPGGIAGSKTDAAGDDQAEAIASGDQTIVNFRIGTGASGSSGGTLALNDSFAVSFQAKLNSSVAVGGDVYSNIARITGSAYDTTAKYSNDATAFVSTLAVKLSLFNGNFANANTVKLFWQTSSELPNNEKFNVQRSSDGINFAVIATVKGLNNSSATGNYTYSDVLTSSIHGYIYYRLQQVDPDGRVTYSQIIKLKTGSLGNAFALLGPNPFATYLDLSATLQSSETFEVVLTTQSGQLITKKSLSGMQGYNTFRLDNLSNLASSLYYVVIKSSSGNQTFKVVKQ